MQTLTDYALLRELVYSAKSPKIPQSILEARKVVATSKTYLLANSTSGYEIHFRAQNALLSDGTISGDTRCSAYRYDGALGNSEIYVRRGAYVQMGVAQFKVKHFKLLVKLCKHYNIEFNLAGESSVTDYSIPSKSRV